MEGFKIIDTLTRKALDAVAPFVGMTTFAEDDEVQAAIDSLEPVDKTPPNFQKADKDPGVVHRSRRLPASRTKRSPLGH